MATPEKPVNTDIEDINQPKRMLVYATSSNKRYRMTRERYGNNFNGGVHAVSPEGETGFEEPKEGPPLESAEKKVGAVAHFLGLISRIPESWEVYFKQKRHASLQRLSELDLLGDEEIELYVLASDVQTIIATSLFALSNGEGKEVFKLERDLTRELDGMIDLNRSANQQIIADDKAEVSRIYQNESGFVVLYKVAFDLICAKIFKDQDGNEAVSIESHSGAEFAIRAMLLALSQEEIDAAYTSPELPNVGPRVDLASIIKNPDATSYGPEVRDFDSPDAPWMKLSPEEVYDMVVFGIPLDYILNMMIAGCGYDASTDSLPEMTVTSIEPLTHLYARSS